MLNCVAFRTLPRPALHGRIGAASVATWVVPVVVAVVLLVDLWAELRKDGTGAGFAPFAVAAESLRLWALVYGAAAPLLALVFGSWLVTSRAALTTKLVASSSPAPSCTRSLRCRSLSACPSPPRVSLPTPLPCALWRATDVRSLRVVSVAPAREQARH